MFTECFRCTKGLEQPASMLFYQGKVISGPGTELDNRPKSQKVVNLLHQKLRMDTKIPRLGLDIHPGATMREKSTRSGLNFTTFRQQSS